VRSLGSELRLEARSRGGRREGFGVCAAANLTTPEFAGYPSPNFGLIDTSTRRFRPSPTISYDYKRVCR
jgi:hypothetical protein